MTKRKRKHKWYCQYCGSTDVTIRALINPNEPECWEGLEDQDTPWCIACQTDTGLSFGKPHPSKTFLADQEND